MVNYLNTMYSNKSQSSKASKKESTKKALERSKAFMRSSLARRINMRKTPQLHFKYDGTLDYANKIDRGLKEVMKNSNKED